MAKGPRRAATTLDAKTAARWGGDKGTAARVRDNYREAARRFPLMFQDMAMLAGYGRGLRGDNGNDDTYAVGVHDAITEILRMGNVDVFSLNAAPAEKEARHARPEPRSEPEPGSEPERQPGSEPGSEPERQPGSEPDPAIGGGE